MLDTGGDKNDVSTRRDAKRRLGLAVAVLGGIVAVAAFGISDGGWPGGLRPADRFGPSQGGEPNVWIDAAQVGDTVLAVMVHAEAPVRLDEVTPVVDEDSALAAVEVVACRHRDGAPLPGAVVGEPLSSFCQSVHSPTEMAIGPDDGGEIMLLVVVQPLEAGRVFIDGVRLTHSRGPFHRTERTGSALEITAA